MLDYGGPTRDMSVGNGWQKALQTGTQLAICQAFGHFRFSSLSTALLLALHPVSVILISTTDHTAHMA